MAEAEDFGRRTLRHVSITGLRESTAYTFPTRNQERKPLRNDYAAHARSLVEQLTAALGELPTPDRRLPIEGLKRGTVVEVSTLRPADDSRTSAVKIPTALEFPSQDILLLNTRRNSDRTESALLFVPDAARTFLRERIEGYGRAPGNERRSDLDRFEPIEAVNAPSVQALFVGDIDVTSLDEHWWEVWVPQSGEIADRLTVAAANANLEVSSDRLNFPDTTVLFFHSSARALSAFASRVPGAIAEIRRATGTIEPFLNRDGAGLVQHDWVAELASRVVPPPDEAPVVCILDTGVSAQHPLLAPGLRAKWAYDLAWGTDDHVPHGGHGTGLLGLVLFGDLEPLLNSGHHIELVHGAESMKFLPPRGFPRTQPPSYGIVTQGACALAETERPGVTRSFCIATSATDFPPNRPSSWSGAVDQISAGAMPGDPAGVSAAQKPKRLILIATGNILEGPKDVVETPQPVEDPSQSWNAITIGGFTRKDQAPAPPPTLRPLVAANERSPFSRSSQTLPEDLTPIKPEVLFEAGNMVSDANDFCEWHPSVSLLSAGSDVMHEPLVPFWATSAAVGMAGHFVGRLQAALPDYWPETHRALMVDSANWPIPIRRKFIGRGAHWKSGSKKQKQALLREVGYGVPDLGHAILSAQNDVTLIAESEIQPYAFGADGRTGVFNEMHFYDLPWPKTILEQLENEIVSMKVTLSYFIEPNISGRAATRPETYRSYGLRFAMKKRTESAAAFRARVNASQAKDGSVSENEKSCWLLGPKAIQAGSLHCDVWRGHAIDLAGHDTIAIYPVGGWWKSHTGQRRMTDTTRYSLVVSISAPGQAVDLHAEITSLIEARVAATIGVESE